MDSNLTCISSNFSNADITKELLDPSGDTGVLVYYDVISFQPVRVVILVLYFIGIALATFGNVVVVLIIKKRRSLRRNPAILLILNLAFCDLISCVVYRPLLLVELFVPFLSKGEVFHDQLDKCRAATYFQGVLAGVGFHTMVLISLERLLLIVFPLKAKVVCTYKLTLKLLAAIWMTSCVLHLPVPLHFEQVVKVNIDGTILSFCGHFSRWETAKVYYSVMFAFYFAIPLVMLSVSYTKIFKTLLHSSCELDTSSRAAGKAMVTRRKLAKMMLCVSVVFAVCWGPSFLFYLWVYCFGKVRQNGFFTATVVQFLPIISSAINPFIYTINSKTFQAGFRRLLCSASMHNGDSSIYRSFNSLAPPNYNGDLPQAAFIHRGSTFSMRQSTRFSNNCIKNFRSSTSEKQSLDRRTRHLLYNNLAIHSHARRNTFIDSDARWQNGIRCPHTAPVTPVSGSPFLHKKDIKDSAPLQEMSSA